MTSSFVDCCCNNVRSSSFSFFNAAICFSSLVQCGHSLFSTSTIVFDVGVVRGPTKLKTFFFWRIFHFGYRPSYPSMSFSHDELSLFEPFQSKKLKFSPTNGGFTGKIRGKTVKIGHFPPNLSLDFLYEFFESECLSSGFAFTLCPIFGFSGGGPRIFIFGCDLMPQLL